MIIELKNLEEKRLNHFYGGNKEYLAQMYVDEQNKIMQGKLIPGASIGMHKHETSSEIIYVLNGKGKMLYDDSIEELTSGMVHYCPKGHAHSFINDSNEDLVFIAVVPQQ
jgi:quercetin dioxygenase-like cupin family protein